jgi:hypothetical protein
MTRGERNAAVRGNAAATSADQKGWHREAAIFAQGGMDDCPRNRIQCAKHLTHWDPSNQNGGPMTIATDLIDQFAI